jgi:hypothetical protein
MYEIVSRRALGSCVADHDERARTARLSWTGLALAAAFMGALWLRSVSWPAALAVAAIALAIYMTLGWMHVLSPAERHAWTTTVLRTRTSSR